MKIVQIEDFFHPNAGYQINILSKYFVRHGHEVTIVTACAERMPQQLADFFGVENIAGYDREYTQTTGVQIIRLPVYGFVSGRAIFTGELRKTVDRLQPDVLFAHDNDTASAMQFIAQLGHLPYAFVTDSHMLAMASVNRFNKLFHGFYRLVMAPKLKKYAIPVIRTQDDPYVERVLGVPLRQAPWISFGSDTLLFHPDAQAKQAFRARNGIPADAFVILYAGKLDEAKGGKLLAEALGPALHSERPVVCLVVGNTSGPYGQEVEALFSASQNRILRFPTQRYVDLAPFYQAADLAVFPKQCSLSFYDVQACGLPVLSEDNNINKDRNAHGNGLCFAAGDAEDLRSKIQTFLDMPAQTYRQMAQCACQFIADAYDYEDKAREYEQILQDACAAYKAAQTAR
ncbi:MAG TPA: glycosyltransferase family 4 protein [Candidatus Gemmiger excrementipullorum]|uniref:Glycosyltransferase family 4 protein n=1 Tax=Candidatus Gemmiger excrementipullorum TaxID=2838610 RepID=A0A9D2BUH3_9FIRM|nr:glycosyltransferase family 4 protein [Candidatus Gemmiger excrementipullorum]